MIKLIDDLWFKRRDIVSDGFNESLDYIGKIIPLKVHKIPSGTRCWTWTVPEKWTVKSAYIEDTEGNRLLDLKNHPLHVLSYSLPVDKVVSKEELFRHLHISEKRPKAIPFEYKYYDRDWGFCVQAERLKDFSKDKYRVFIDAKFEKDVLRLGESHIKGRNKDTIVIAAHLCHPAMVNDDLSGVAVLAKLAKELHGRKNNYSYKILFLPETIGSIAFLSQNMNIIPHIKYGIFLEMLGNDNSLALQFSHQGNTKIDKIARYAMSRRLKIFREGPFRSIVRNDEMVFNGPGVNIPMISISRSPYPEYHTSDDNPSIISEERLDEAGEVVSYILDVMERDYLPKRNFTGPIFLSGFGLWVDWKTNPELKRTMEKIMLNLEGDLSIFDISEKVGLDFENTWGLINKLKEKRLVV